jgi:hypothetical protein
LVLAGWQSGKTLGTVARPAAAMNLIAVTLRAAVGLGGQTLVDRQAGFKLSYFPQEPGRAADDPGGVGVGKNAGPVFDFAAQHVDAERNTVKKTDGGPGGRCHLILIQTRQHALPGAVHTGAGGVQVDDSL